MKSANFMDREKNTRNSYELLCCEKTMLSIGTKSLKKENPYRIYSLDVH